MQIPHGQQSNPEEEMKLNGTKTQEDTAKH